MRTVIETPTLQKQADKLWSDAERLAFIDWIVANPLATSFPVRKALARFAGLGLVRVSQVA